MELMQLQVKAEKMHYYDWIMDVTASDIQNELMQPTEGLDKKLALWVD